MEGWVTELIKLVGFPAFIILLASWGAYKLCKAGGSFIAPHLNGAFEAHARMVNGLTESNKTNAEANKTNAETSGRVANAVERQTDICESLMHGQAITNEVLHKKCEILFHLIPEEKKASVKPYFDKIKELLH